MALAEIDRRAAQPRAPRLTQMPPAARQVLLQSKLPLPVVLYLLAVVLPIGFNVGPLAMTLLRVMLLIMVLPLFGKLITGKLGRIFLTDILFFAHIFWATLALALNNPNLVVQQIGSVGVEFIGGYLIGRAYIRTPDDFIALCRMLTIIVCCTFPLALIETLTGRPVLLETIKQLPGVTTAVFNFQEGRLGLERVQLGFAHPIHYGLFCAVAFSLTFVGLKDIMQGVNRWLTSAVVGLCGFLALSSGALLALALQIGLISWAWLFRKMARRWLLLLGMFMLAYVVIDMLSNRTPIQVFMSYATFSAHTAYWRGIIFEWGMVNVWANPIFGIGLNDWVRPWYMYSGSMDNFWLVMAVRYGIPGFLILAVGYVLPLWQIGRRDFSADTIVTKLRLAWMFSFMGLTFTLTTVHVWTNIYSFVFFMFGAGMWMILYQSPATKPDEIDGSDSEQNPQSPIDRLRYTRFQTKRRRETPFVKAADGDGF